MKIQVLTGTGSGPNKLAAYDAALRDAGVANFNLIYLSSVVPPASEIAVLPKGQPVALDGSTWGDRLYVVAADTRVDTPNVDAWSGIGWVQGDDGRGLFVEHEGESEQHVRRDIEDSLAALKAGRPELQFGETNMSVVGVTCERDPVCALSLAVFESSPWTA